MPKKLSTKHRMFAKNLIKTKGNNRKAYKLTYPDATDITAKNRGSELVRTHPEIRSYLVETLDKRGVSIDTLVGGLKRLLNAKKETIMPSGEKIKTTDNSTRLQAVKTGFELHGALKAAGSINTDRRSINIDMRGRETGELKSLTNKLNELNKALALDSGAQDGEIVDADFSTTDDTISLD